MGPVATAPDAARFAAAATAPRAAPLSAPPPTRPWARPPEPAAETLDEATGDPDTGADVDATAAAGRPWRLALVGAGVVLGFALLAGRDWHPSAPDWGAWEGLGLWLAKIAQHPVRSALAILFLVLASARVGAFGAPATGRTRSRAPP